MQQVALGKAMKNNTWISDDNKLDPDILPDLPGYHVLVRPISIKKKKLKVVYYYLMLLKMIYHI